MVNNYINKNNGQSFVTSQHWTHKLPLHNYIVRNPGSGLGQARKCGEVNGIT